MYIEAERSQWGRKRIQGVFHRCQLFRRDVWGGRSGSVRRRVLGGHIGLRGRRQMSVGGKTVLHGISLMFVERHR
jgi:hypothetical protein